MEEQLASGGSQRSKVLSRGNAMSRTMGGAITGSGVGVALCVGSLMPILILRTLLSDPALIDPRREVEYVLASIASAVLVGCFVGAIGGVASRMPKRGFPMLTSIGVVGGGMALARFATLVVMPFEKFGYPYWLAIAGALLGGMAVLLCGLLRSRSASNVQSADGGKPQDVA